MTASALSPKMIEGLRAAAASRHGATLPANTVSALASRGLVTRPLWSQPNLVRVTGKGLSTLSRIRREEATV